MVQDMKKEEELEEQKLTLPPWAITNDVKEYILKATEAVERSRREFESQILPCPFDGSISKFIRYEGAYTRGWAMFKCQKKNHEIQVG